MMTTASIQIAANGSRRSCDQPGLPLGLSALVSDLTACATLGAREFHVHPRDAQDRQSLEPDRVAAWVSDLRSAVSGCTVSISTGEWIAPLNIRLSQIAQWSIRPDYASVNFHEAGAELIADALIAQGVGIEAGIASGHSAVRFLDYRRRRFCRRVLIEMADTLHPLADMTQVFHALGQCLADHEVILHGEGESAWPMLREARRRGLMSRIGFEDTLALPDGRTARSNADLLKAAMGLTQRLGGLALCA